MVPALLPVTLLLRGIAFVSMLAFDFVAFHTGWFRAQEVGLACGLLSCVIAAWGLPPPAGRSIAPLVFFLSLVATVLSGPITGFVLL